MKRTSTAPQKPGIMIVTMVTVVDFDIEDETSHGAGGYLRLERYRLVNVRADGSRSPGYACDFAARPGSPDAVVVALYRQVDDRTEVLIRRGLRPALQLGRAAHELPVNEDDRQLLFPEVVAGVIEPGDRGAEGILKRAAKEASEEAGYELDVATFRFLGAGAFPTPGSMPEKYWFVAAPVPREVEPTPPQGDGSPMEEGAVLEWMELDEGIAACVRGSIEDIKTELIFRRLKDALNGRSLAWTPRDP